MKKTQSLFMWLILNEGVEVLNCLVESLSILKRQELDVLVDFITYVMSV